MAKENKARHAAERAKGFFGEFKDFISRGSVVDLAVGVVVGGAFTAIVNSLVNDIIMPTIGFLFGGVNFSSLRIVLRPATETAAEAALCYGNFIQAAVNFLLISFVIFLVIRQINRFRRKKEEIKEEEPAPVVSPETELLTEIRDLLKENRNGK